MTMRVRKVRFHQAAWIERGGLWVIECDTCQSYGAEFLAGYAVEEQATTVALKHRCNPAAVAQVERGEA